MTNNQAMRIKPSPSSLLALFLALALGASPASSQAGMTMGQALRRLSTLRTQADTKGEFETTQQWQRRRSQIAIQIRGLLRQLYPGSGTLKVEAYNADSQAFPIQIQGEGFTVDSRLPMSQASAPTFKQTSRSAVTSGRFWLEEDGKVYLAGSATVRAGGRTYMTLRGPWTLALGGSYHVAEYPSSVKALQFSPDGRLLAIHLESASTMAGDFPAREVIWDLSADTVWRQLPTLSSVVPAAFSANGDLIAAEDGEAAVQVWNVRQGQLVTTLHEERPPVAEGQPANANVTPGRIAFSPDGGRITRSARTSFYDPGHLTTWDLSTGQKIQTLADSDAVYDVPCWAPDGRLLAFGRHAVPDSNEAGFEVNWPGGLWDAVNHTLIRNLGTHNVTAAAFSKDCGLLATVDDQNGNRVWNTSTGDGVDTFSPPTKPDTIHLPAGGTSWIGEAITDLMFYPDGRFLAMLGHLPLMGVNLSMWDFHSRSIARILGPLMNVDLAPVFSPDGSKIAIVDGGEVRVFDIRIVP